MNRLILLLITLFSFTSCTDKTTLEYALANGLEKYDRKRPVDKKLNDDFFIKEIAVYKKDSITYNLIFKLNDDVIKEVALKYSMAIHVFVAKEFLIERDDYLLLDYKPEVEVYNSNNYFIREFKTQAKRIDTLDVFLFDRDKYRK